MKNENEKFRIWKKLPSVIEWSILLQITNHHQLVLLQTTIKKYERNWNYSAGNRSTKSEFEE